MAALNAGLLLAAFTAIIVLISGKKNAERRLFDSLMRHYDTGSRPVLNANTTLMVNFSISLNVIMDLVEKNQTLITHVWIYEEWIDEMLQWNPRKFDDIKSMIFPSNRLWLPDLYIFNNADVGYEGFVNVNDSRLSVTYEGRVQWVVPLIIKSSCAVDVTYFPFDNQRCFIRFGSWIYEESQLNLVLKDHEVDMSPYTENSELELAHQILRREVKTYDIFSGRYPQIDMLLHIRRKSVYYGYTVLAPTLVLCILTLFSFLLPCDNGDKVGIGLTVFLSLYVLQLSIAENIPESNSMPLIGLFLTLVMTLNSISLVFATLVINIKKKGDRKCCPCVPEIVLKVCKKFLSKITCTPFFNFNEFYGHCDDDYTSSSEEATSIEEDENDDDSLRSEDLGPSTSAGYENIRLMTLRQRPVKGDVMANGGAAAGACASDEEPPPLTREQRAIRRGLKQGVIPRDPRYEWFFVAEVLDKTLFFVFLVAMVVTVSTSLLIVPWLHRDDKMSLDEEW